MTHEDEDEEFLMHKLPVGFGYLCTADSVLLKVLQTVSSTKEALSPLHKNSTRNFKCSFL